MLVLLHDKLAAADPGLLARARTLALDRGGPVEGRRSAGAAAAAAAAAAGESAAGGAGAGVAEMAAGAAREARRSAAAERRAAAAAEHFVKFVEAEIEEDARRVALEAALGRELRTKVAPPPPPPPPSY